MNSHVMTLLRAALAFLAVGTVGLLILIVALSLDGDPEPFFLIVVVGTVVCAQVALFAIWKLLSMVRRDEIFDIGAFRRVRILSAAVLIASVLMASMLAVVGQTDDAPGAILMGGGVLLIGIAFALLMAVMSGLLRTATGYRTELSEVV